MIYRTTHPVYKYGVELKGFKCELYRTLKDAKSALAFFMRCSPSTK